jgi:hypothetical protein
MSKQYKVLVFGKAGCDKCKVLNHRLDSLLARDEWADFQKVSLDLETEEGLVEFCKAECVNPQRVPAFVVAEVDEQSGRLQLLPAVAERATASAKATLFGCLGLQTDYSDEGRGVITPRMIESVLAEARTQ